MNSAPLQLVRAFGAWVFLLGGLAFAQPNPAYDPPPGYYSSATGLTGSALKSALHNIVDNHTVVPYTASGTDVWDALMVLDEDPANASNVILVYSGVSRPKTDTNGNGNTGTNESWEREHCWPKSYGVIDTGPDTSDLFNLRACRRSVNASRGNRYYAQAALSDPAEPAVAPPNCPECLYDHSNGQGGIWTPRPSEKGDLARVMFYMAVRYDGTDSGTVDLELSDMPDPDNGTFGKLSDLIAWSNADPVSEEERHRNQRIYSLYQGNRNPFVDHPEMIAAIFGGVPSSPAIAITISPQAVNEGATGTGQVSIPSAVASQIVISLGKTGDPSDSEISIPSSVTIAAGMTSATFTVTALADGVVDGDKSVSVLAAASGYTTGLANVSVIDIDQGTGGGLASIPIGGAGFYTQNFDGLPSSGAPPWNNATTIPGWYAQRSGTATTIIAGTGSGATGGLYSFGTSAADRALGSLGSGGATAGSFAWGASFRNTTGKTVTLGNLSYVGEEWRYGGTAAAQTVGFSYRIGNSLVTALTPASDTGWTGYMPLDFVSPVTAGTTGALDGNSAPNRVALGANLGLQLAPGQWVTFRWRDIDHPGNDHGLAIDEFRLEWTVPPDAPVITSSLAASARTGAAFNYTITAGNSPAFFEAEGLPDGLSVNGLTGVVSGMPEQAGEFEVTILAGNEGGIDEETLILTVDLGATSFAAWSGGAMATPALIRSYAIGGAAGPNATGEAASVSANGGVLVLTAIIRVDDPKLTVTGEASTDLLNFGEAAGFPEISGVAQGVSQTGVPLGCQRQEFRMAVQGRERLFIRLRTELRP